MLRGSSPFLTLVPDITVFAYVCGLFYLCTTAIAVGYGPQQFLLNKILYGGVLIAFLVDIVLRRWPIYPAESQPHNLGGRPHVSSKISVIIPALNERRIHRPRCRLDTLGLHCRMHRRR